jgi:hypothetical protein
LNWGKRLTFPARTRYTGNGRETLVSLLKHIRGCLKSLVGAPGLVAVEPASVEEDHRL